MNIQESKQILTANEYVAWLEVSIASALAVIDKQDKLINNLTRDKEILQRELFNYTKQIFNSPYALITEKEV